MEKRTRAAGLPAGRKNAFLQYYNEHYYLVENFGYRIVAEVDRATFFNASTETDSLEGNGNDKVRLVFKEPWRDEALGAHIGF
ncbi:hypothetical protein OSTOST_03815 [Ostertagia ostertagi]